LTGKLASEYRMIMDGEYFSDAFYWFHFVVYFAILTHLHRLSGIEGGW
jgi:hypothetical protein